VYFDDSVHVLAGQELTDFVSEDICLNNVSSISVYGLRGCPRITIETVPDEGTPDVLRAGVGVRDLPLEDIPLLPTPAFHPRVFTRPPPTQATASAAPSSPLLVLRSTRMSERPRSSATASSSGTAASLTGPV
jgi:hypothetical protein